MKIKKTSEFTLGERILHWAPLVITAGAGVYAFYTLLTSGIVPTKYLIAAAVAIVALLALVGFLWMRFFKHKWARITAKTIAVILMILLIAGGVLGSYLLQSGVSTIDKFAGKGDKVVSVATEKPFNIFISGIDTYGDIATTSRSDVNIAATVDPKGRKVLLTTLPRDSYVKIPLGGNNQYDKLTHAGNYGVEASMGAVATTLDTPIDAYLRINFTSFIGSIDTLGGITVHNPTAFTSFGQSFPAGDIQLDGKRALVFSRERKSLQGGDVDRGKNQQRVIQGIVDKITQIRSLDGYNALLNLIGDSVDTNLSSDAIKQLINQQLNNPGNWTTESYSVKGKGQTGGLKSYAMPSAQLYMYVLNKDSLATAQQQIKAIIQQ